MNISIIDYSVLCHVQRINTLGRDMIIETHPPNFDVPAAFACRKEWIMKKITTWLLVSVASVALGGAVLSALYTGSLSKEMAALRKENRNDASYLRSRIRELDAELASVLLDRLNQPTLPADGEAETFRPDETSPSTHPDDPEAITERADFGTGDSTQAENRTEAEETAAPSTEEVTLPTHQSPETEAPTEDAPETISALYLIAERDGVIGLFDASGELLQVANVFVMTLPEADRKALAVGISAGSLEEALSILYMYE